MGSKKEKKRKKSESNGDVGTPSTSRRLRRTVSVAIGASCVENAVSHELGSILAGQLARAMAIFNIDEVIVLDDGPKHGRGEVSRAAALLAKILQYQETPQYLRKALIPMHELYRYCGMLAPLDAPHHLRATEWLEFREGVVTGGEGGQSFCDIGLELQAKVVGDIPQNARVTLHVGKERRIVRWGTREYIEATVASHLDVKRQTGTYWGYSVRIARSLSELFDSPFGKYDLTIGTSERGEVNDCCSLSLPDYSRVLIVIGGPQGLEYALEHDEQKQEHEEPSTLFDRYLNVCPNQGSRTIRTEEAVLLCLMYLKPALGL